MITDAWGAGQPENFLHSYIYGNGNEKCPSISSNIVSYFIKQLTITTQNLTTKLT